MPIYEILGDTLDRYGGSDLAATSRIKKNG